MRLHTPPLLLSLLGVITGCAVDPSAEDSAVARGVRADPLFGTTNMVDCDASEVTKIVAAMEYGKHVVPTPFFRECVLSSQIRPCKAPGGVLTGITCGNNDDNWDREDVLAATSSPNDMDLTCAALPTNTNGTTSWWDQHEWMHDKDETFKLDKAFLAASATPRIAGTIWHEAMHTHGYQHGTNDGAEGDAAQCCGYAPGSYTRYLNSVPHVVQGCIRDAVGPNLFSHYAARWPGPRVTSSLQSLVSARLAQRGYTPDYIEQDLLGGQRAFPTDQVVTSGGWVLRDASIAVGKIDVSPGKDVVFAAIDHNDGNDYWRIRLGTQCGKSGCTLSPKENYVLAGSADMHTSSVATADFNFDGRDDVVLAGIDTYPGGRPYWRWTILSNCNSDLDCARSNVQYAFPGADATNGGSVAAGNLDDNPLPEIVFASTDNNAGNDYWRVIVFWNCDSLGRCQDQRGIPQAVPAGAAVLKQASVAIGDLNGDGRNELFMMGIDDYYPDYYRYAIGRDCGAGGCTWTAPRYLTSEGKNLGYASVTIGELASDTPGKEVMLTTVDLWDDGLDYYRSRAGRRCDIYTGECSWGPERIFLTNGWSIQGVGTAAVDLDSDGVPELMFASADVNDGYDYWRYNSVGFSGAADLTSYLFSPYGEPNDRAEEATWLPAYSGSLSTYSTNYTINDPYSSSASTSFSPTHRLYHISGRNDVDWYRFDVTSTSTHSIRIEFDKSRGDLDLALYDAAGTLVGFSASGTESFELISRSLTPGRYYAKVYGYNGSTGAYGISHFVPLKLITL